MHELSLYGQVTFARYEQVLNILAGVAAMQPQRVFERNIIYKPTREPEEPGIGHRIYSAEDLEGHRWMFGQPV